MHSTAFNFQQAPATAIIDMLGPALGAGGRWFESSRPDRFAIWGCMRAFNVGGRIISTLSGLAVLLAGGIWILQAFDLAFNGPLGPGGAPSFMVNDRRWAVYGLVAVLLGCWQVAWSNSHRR